MLIDALDECREEDRSALLEILNDLMATSPQLHVFISGRPEVDIQKALAGRVIVKIGVEDNQLDIAKYVQEKMTRHPRWDKFTESTKVEVVNTLLEKSKGMSVISPSQCSFPSNYVVSDADNIFRFRLTALQVDELLLELFEEDLKARLPKLPKDLTAAYDEIYSRQISKHGRVRSAVTERALIWVLAARTPVSSALLLSAVRIDVDYYNDHLLDTHSTKSTVSLTKDESDHVEYITSEVDEDLLQKLCTNLLTLNSNTDQWTFAHASVAEYIQEHHFSLTYAHSYLGFACLMLIIDLSESKSTNRPIGAAGGLGLASQQTHQMIDHPVFKYAIEKWVGHVARVDQDLEDSISKIRHWQDDAAGSQKNMKTDRLSLLVEIFFGDTINGSRAYCFWCEHTYKYYLVEVLKNFWPWYSPSYRFGRCELLKSSISRKDMVSTVIALGLTCLSARWWEKLKVPPQLTVCMPESHERGNHLHVASVYGTSWIVSALLDAGMDINMRTSHGRLPLTLAHERHRSEAARTLFERGGYDSKSLTGRENPQYQALMRENADVVGDLLLCEGYRNQSGTGSDSACGSVSASTAAVLQILVEECVVGALHSTHEWEHDMALFLQEFGIDLDVQSIGGVDMLTAQDLDRFTRTWESSIGMLELIPFTCGSLLESACSDGNLVAVRFMVEAWGQDVNAVSGEGVYGTPLIAAVCRDQAEVVEYLLNSGAEVNCQVAIGFYHSALTAAVCCWDSSMMRVLVEHGTDVNLQLEHGECGSALAYAVGAHECSQSEWQVPFLINNGADVNMVLRRGRHGSALVAAVASRPSGSSGALENLKLLLDAGADPNLALECGDYGSPLIAAAAVGDPSIVRCLLDCGANVNYATALGYFDTALMVADSEGNADIFQCLVDNGADVNRPETREAEGLLAARAQKRGQEPSKLFYFMRSLEARLPSHVRL